MNKFTIMADGSCDLKEEFQQNYDIRVLQSHMSLPSGEEISSRQNWELFSHDEFYTLLKKDPASFSTAPPSIVEFENAFIEEIKAGKDVICFVMSGAMSGTFNFANMAKEKVLESYPNAKIEIIDSRRFGPGLGLMCIYASIMRAEGKTIDEVVNYFNENKNRFHQMGWLDDLSFLAKKGRLTNAKAFFGTIIGVTPMGEFDYNGLTTVIAKIKGKKKALESIIAYMEQTGKNLSEQIIFIAQTDRMKFAEMLKEMIEEKFSPKAVYICDVYALNGVNIGPGLMAAYYVGKPISEGLTYEKEIMENIING